MDLRSMSIEELTELNRRVVDTIRAKRKGARAEAVLGFSKGDRVTIDHKKVRGQIGVVEKVNRTRMNVLIGGVSYAVPATMCTVAE